MAKLRKCPSCGGTHRLKRRAKACATAHSSKPWTKKELGL